MFVTHNVREAARLGDRIVLLTSRPGRVAAVYPIDLPRPRPISSPAIANLASLRTDGRRRARVPAFYPTALPRPRRIASTEIANLASMVTDELRSEMRRHAR